MGLLSSLLHLSTEASVLLWAFFSLFSQSAFHAVTFLHLLNKLTGLLTSSPFSDSLRAFCLPFLSVTHCTDIARLSFPPSHLAYNYINSLTLNFFF